jgi:sodium transport system permease protein
MRALWTVFRKELLENARDRRTLFSALVFGPLLGPLLFGVMVSRIVAENAGGLRHSVVLAVVHGERAPDLLSYLTSAGTRLRRAPFGERGARDAVVRGLAGVVLIVPRDYPRRFAHGEPARVLLVADSADNSTRRDAARAGALLQSYASSIAQRRLQVRGVDPLVAAPVTVDSIDVASASARAVSLIGLMTYFVLFAVLMGGLYFAIDATAGERERGSLEPLLMVPIARGALVGGKILATCAAMAASLAICLAAFLGVLHLLPLERLGMRSDFGPWMALEFFAICTPFVPLGAALMTFVASFTRSYREAQSYVAAVLLVPTLPIAFASIYSLRASPAWMFVPSLSQHLLMTSLLEGRPIAPIDALVSAASSVLVALLLFGFTQRQWRREAMLG